MPSPFPGMDPFLEHPLLWPMLQQHLVGYLADTLGEILPRRYQVEVRERSYKEEPDHDVFPAGSPPVQNCPLTQWQKPQQNSENSPAPCWHIALAPEEVRESYVAIYVAGQLAEVVTLIEVLTLPNKTPGDEGRLQYRSAQRQALVSPAHLLEIDLLRSGLHTVVAPRERLLRRGPFDYLVCLSRAGQRDFCAVWGIPLEQPLPRVAVPLLAGDPDLQLDLQALLTTCYQAASCSRWIDYSAEPYFPLTRRQQQWVDQVLRTHNAITQDSPQSTMPNPPVKQSP